MRHRATVLLSLLCLQAALVSGSIISDDAVISDPTNLASAGCHRAVDPIDGILRFLVIDAGSTATRAVLHRFRLGLATRPNQSPLFRLRHLGQNRFQRSPGLSAFKNFPERSRAQLESLLQDAAAQVPGSTRGLTCVALRATAGLRLLDVRSRRRILRAAKEALDFSPVFLAPDTDSTRVLSGPEEARLAWLSVNYMLGRLTDWNNETAAVLEMGGGSTQVAYEDPNGELLALPARSRRPDSSAKNPADSRSQSTRRLRSRSYLGLGIQESVLRFVGYNDSSRVAVYSSRCIASNLSLEFSFGPVKLSLSGESRAGANTSSSSDSAAACMARADQLIRDLNVLSEPGLSSAAKSPALYAIAGVYHLLKYLHKKGAASVAFSDAVCPLQPRGECKAYTATVALIEESARAACRDPPRHGQYEPYYCINLSVLAALLKRFRLQSGAAVVGLGGSKSLGWTLGFSLDALTESVEFALSSSSTLLASAERGLLVLTITLLLLFRRLSCRV